jgi:hypothetical protein
MLVPAFRRLEIEHRPRALPVSADAGDEGTIFVSIISYRDTECQHTLASLFETAKRPERIYVGLVWQLSEKEDAACFVRTLPVQWAKQVGTPSQTILHAHPYKSV